MCKSVATQSDGTFYELDLICILWLCLKQCVNYVSIQNIMEEKNLSIAKFLKEVMRRQKRLPSQIAADLDMSHSTIIRWLSGEDIPSVRSCRRLAEYSGTPLNQVLAIVGHIPQATEAEPNRWPEFREYALRKYPNELDEDLITVIENLIEIRRKKKSTKIKIPDSGS